MVGWAFNIVRVAHCTKSVFPSTSPSGARFGRYAIHGYARHRPSAARVDYVYVLLDMRKSLFAEQVFSALFNCKFYMGDWVVHIVRDAHCAKSVLPSASPSGARFGRSPSLARSPQTQRSTR